jgi:septal ring factor EnvC (AmiA/AmiB activator)
VPRPDPFARALLPVLLAGAFLCAPASADPSPQQKLDTVEKAMKAGHQQQAKLAKQASDLAAEIQRLRAQSVAAAHAVQEHETTLTRLEDRLTALAVEEKRERTEFEQRRAQQGRLLMALVQLARNPQQGLALTPGDPVDVLRGALLMGAAVPPIEARARALKADIAALATVRGQIADTWAKYSDERDKLVGQKTKLDALIAEKADLQQHASQGAAESGRKLAQLASQAHDLRDLIDRMEAERRRREAEEQARLAPPPSPPHDGRAIEVTAPPPVLLDPGKPRKIRPFKEARGHMVVPASGVLVRAFGDTNSLGITSKGLTFETRPGAVVVAPFDGRIVFAGPFRGYGQILIIGHGGGYHSLLAGLGRVEGSVGQWLVAGEPVGTMAEGTEKPRLYLELRHNNQPINPLPWLAIRDEKVSG